MADDNVEQKAAILKPEVAEKDESTQLDEIKADEKDVKEFYKQFPDETLTAFTKVSSFARDVNVQLAGHEVLIVGKTNHGKSSLLEAIIGHPALIIKGTNRPINFIMINNPECPQPRVTLKRDQYLDITEDVIVSVHDLHAEIQKRNTKELNANPIQIKYEWQYAGNITYIDTPGIKLWDDSDERAKLAIELGRATHRTLLFVEESNDWDHVEVLDFAKKMDSGFARSFFVFTKFHEQLSKFSNQTEWSQYFSKKPECKCFFVSLLNQPTRQASIQGDKYPDRLYQAYRRDIADLEKLKFDRRDESYIGVAQVRTYLMEQIWKQYKEFIPELRKQLANMKKGSNDALKRIQDQMYGMLESLEGMLMMKGLDYNKLRSMSSNYVADWLQIIVNFIDGSSESSVALAGQTLGEESTFSDLGEWSYADQVVYQVPQKDEKLYGGQQFNRMLNVFKGIANMNITITQADIEEAAAVHYGSKFNMSDCTTVATHIVQKKLRALYEPLIEHLTRRSKYILKRLADIGFDVCQNRAALNVKRVASKGAWDDLTLMRGYPYFQSIVRDLFNDYIDKMAAEFSQKCLDDINCSKLIYWQIASNKYPNPQKRSIEELNKTVQAMANDLFRDLKSSIGTGILLKCHSTFLVNMPRNISGEILREVSSFDNNLMEEIFELKLVKGVLKEEEEKERQVLQSYQEQEQVLKDLAAQFTRFKLVANAVLKFQAIQAFMKLANVGKKM